MTTIRERHKIVKTKYIDIVFEGTGDPKDSHEIISVGFIDEDKNFIFGVGDYTALTMPDKYEKGEDR